MIRLSAPVVPVLAVVLLSLAACSGPGSSVRRPAPESLTATERLEALLDAGRHDEVVAAVERELATTREPLDRARLEALRARALVGDGRARSAVLSFARALRFLPEGEDGLRREIEAGWGDAELKLGHGTEAAGHYEAALAAGRLTTRQRDDLCYAGYVALREAGAAGASAWRARISRFSESRLAAVEARLLPPKPKAAEPVLAATGKLIPDDPRVLLPGIHRRVDWGAAAIRGDYHPMTPITRITVHHTALPFSETGSGPVAAELRQLQANHQQKWADLGYHFVIDPGGGIWEGRALQWQGAHEGVGLNQGSIGICLMGNFDTQSVPGAQLAALSELLGACCDRFALTRSDIRTHREVRPDPTDCPGERLQAWMDDYRRSSGPGSLARQ